MEDIIKACRKALKAGIPPKKAVLEGMARGMDIVGERYESYQYFLPDLIMAGEVMNEGVSFLAQHLEKKELKRKLRIVFGTVEGDVHDIGKNIVENLLTAYGFRVIDLGMNVPAKRFVDVMEREKAGVLCMSTLLSLGRDEMRKVSKLLKARSLTGKVKVLIGGVPTDEGFARSIKAEYAKDAIEALDIVKRWEDECG
ncbi:MAG: cobalamin-dependent protein, partial [Candidatus Methanofastidiosia archaeon]